MENVENTQNIETNTNSQENSFASDGDNTGGSESFVEDGKQSIQTQSKQDYTPDFWKSDERAKRGLWKTADDVVKSYFHLEKEFNSKYKPAYAEYEKLNTTFKELGINSEDLPNAWKEYQTLKDPKNENNQFIEKVNYYLQNPEYAQTLQSVFSDLNKRDLQRQYPGYTEEQIQRQMQIEERLQQIEMAKQKEEAELQKKEQERLTIEINKEIEKNIAEIMEFAKDKNITITDEMANDFFKTMKENNLPPKYMKGLFMQLYQKEIFDNLNKKASDTTIKKLNKQNSRVIPTSTSSTGQVQKPAKLEDRFKQRISPVIDKIFGKT